jgi:hypothetical protein
MVRLTRRTVAALLSVGALGIAATTALEVLTAPYSPAVSAYPLNGVVHLAKVAAVGALVAGLLGFGAHCRDRLGRVGSGSIMTLAIATVLGAVPYSLAEASLDSSLDPAAANQQLDALYASSPWIGTVAMIALPLTVLSIVTLAVVVLRRGAVARWAPITSLAAIPVAIAAGALTDAGVLVPHAPAWIFLGLIAYGPALMHAPRLIQFVVPAPEHHGLPPY